MSEERITYDEFMIMFKFAPKMCYTLYDKAEDEIERLNNIINELEKELNKKKEAIKTIKDMLGEETKNVNPHIEVLETEYKYFLDKLKELKDSD